MFQNKMTLIFGSDDVKGLVNISEVIEGVETAYKAHAKGKYVMDPKTHVILPQYEGEYEAMPCHLFEPSVSCMKWVAIRLRNREKFGLPTATSVIIYNDPESGFPLAIGDASLITRMRTGAAGGVGTKYLSRKNSKILALVGAGAQSETQLAAIATVRELTKVYVVDPKTSKLAEMFVKNMEKIYDFDILQKEKIEDAVSDADIITTTTPSRSPIVKNEWISPGTHINAIGADEPGKEELDPAILLRSKVVVDDIKQTTRDGEVNVPISRGIYRKENIYGTIGEIIVGLKDGRTSDDEITVFDSSGIALQDAVTVKLFYERLMQSGKGLEKKIIPTL